MGRQLVTLREGEVSQLGQQGHVRDAEGKSAGLPLTLHIPPCPQTKKKGKKVQGKVSISHRSCTKIQIHRHGRFHHQFPGGLDHELYQVRRFRISEAWVQSESASHIPLHFDLRENPRKMVTRSVSLSFPSMTSRGITSHFFSLT